MTAVMNQSANTQDAEIAFEVEFYREIAKDRIIEAYFDGTLNTRQFLDMVREIYAEAQMQAETDTMAMKVLMSTRARVRREIMLETRSAVAEKENLEQQLQKMGETEMSLRAKISAYEEQFQEMNGFKMKYLELKERVDAQASRTLDESAPKVEQLSQELSATREASMTLRKEREDAEIRLVQACKEVQRLTEQKSKHELELEQLRKQIEASQQAGRNAYAAGTQLPLASPEARASLLYTPISVTPGFQPGNGVQYTTMQQPIGYGGIAPSLPVQSTDELAEAQQQRLMKALQSPEFGVVSAGDARAAATRVNALTALHALRSQFG